MTFSDGGGWISCVKLASFVPTLQMTYKCEPGVVCFERRQRVTVGALLLSKFHAEERLAIEIEVLSNASDVFNVA